MKVNYCLANLQLHLVNPQLRLANQPTIQRGERGAQRPRQVPVNHLPMIALVLQLGNDE